jgi:hypothetical protein
MDVDFRFSILVRDPKNRFAVELDTTPEKRGIIKLEIGYLLVCISTRPIN